MFHIHPSNIIILYFDKIRKSKRKKVYMCLYYTIYTFVIYSLGNFISDQNDRDNFTGLAFEVTLNKHVDVEDTITNTIIEPKAELIYTTTTKIRGVNHNFKVVPYPNLTDNELANHNVYYEKYKSIVNERYPNLVWGLSGEVNDGNN